MVSVGAKVVAGVVTRLSLSTWLPRSTEVTLTLGAGAGAGVGTGAGAATGGGGGAGSSFLQPARARVPSSAAASAAGIGLRLMRVSMVSGYGADRSWSVSGRCGRDLQDLAGLDPVGIVQLVAVGVEDPPPLSGLAVVGLGDVREGVAALHGVLGPARHLFGRADRRLHVAEIRLRRRVRLGAADAALDVAEVGPVAGRGIAGFQRQRAGIVGVLAIAHSGLLRRAWPCQISTRPVKGASRRRGRRAKPRPAGRSRYCLGSRPAAGGGSPGVAGQGLMSGPPRRV